MAAVARALRRRERLRDDDRQTAPLPLDDAAVEVGHVLVAELLQRLRGERRARAGAAVDEDRRRAVGCCPLDAATRASRGGCARRLAGGLRPTRAARGRRRRAADPRSRASRRRLGDADLVDLLADLLQELSVGRHWFRKYSDRLRGCRRRRLSSQQPARRHWKARATLNHRGPGSSAGAASRCRVSSPR